MIKLFNILNELELDVPKNTGSVPSDKLWVTGIYNDDIEFLEVTLDGRWMEGKEDKYYQLKLEDLYDTGDVLDRKRCEIWVGIYSIEEIPEVLFLVDLCKDYDDESYYIKEEDNVQIIFKD